MKVKTLKPHSNRHGDKFSKKKGDIYDHSDPATDIAFGYVEAFDPPADVKSAPIKSGPKNKDGASA